MIRTLTMDQVFDLFKIFEEHNKEHDFENITEYIEALELVIETEDIPEEMDTYTFLWKYIVNHGNY